MPAMLCALRKNRMLAEIVSGAAGDGIRQPPLPVSVSPCLQRSGWFKNIRRTTSACYGRRSAAADARVGRI